MYKSLQAFRGLAALVVVFYHARGAISQPKYFGDSALGLSFIFGGTLGVDFFFVLSGFIIFWIHAKDFGHPQRLGAYLHKRALRIYPTYWIIFAAVCCAALFIAPLRQTMPTDAWMFIRALFLLPIDPATVGGVGAPVLTVAWSLQFELAFYLFIALAIVSPRVCLIAVALWACNLVACAGECRFPSAFFADTRILLFALGGATAWLCRATGNRRGAPLPRWTAPLSLALGALLFVAGATWDTLGIAHGQPPAFNAILAVYGSASALSIFGAVKIEDTGRAFGGQRAWQLLGGASYALYLIHYPIVSLVTKAMIRIGLHGVTGAIVTLAAAVCVSVTVAVAFHLRIEQPLLRALNAWRPSTPRALSNPKA